MTDTKEVDMAMTVTGEVPIAELGVTLPHEHLIHRLSIHSGKPDNTCVDTDLMAEELRYFREAGGSTVCDVTPVGVGRDPSALRELSRSSSVNIISGLGLYQLEVWPAALAAMSERSCLPPVAVASLRRPRLRLSLHECSTRPARSWRR